jgi:tetratricopeptide (TPR) repeat protein
LAAVQRPARPSRAVATATLAGFAAFLLGPGLPGGLRPAQAAGSPSIAIFGAHGDGRLGEADLLALTEDLVIGFKNAGFVVVHGEDLKQRTYAARDTILERVFVEAVRQAFEEGRILYEQAQLDLAVDALRRAESAASGVSEFLRDPRLTVDVQLYIGLAQISMGQDDAAREAFGEVVRMDPNRVLDSLDYPPRIVELFEEVRREVLSRQGARIEVGAAAVAGARVFVDGSMVGTTPAVVDGVPPGFHTLMVDGGADGRWSTELTLSSGEDKVFLAKLQRKGLARGDEDPWEGPRSGFSRRLFRELALSAGTDLVAVAAFDEQGNFQLALYSARSQNFSVPATASLSAQPASRSAFVRQLVERVALYADAGGGIKAERVAQDLVSMRLGGNPFLDAALFGTPAAAAMAQAEPEPLRDEDGRREGGGKAGGAVLAVVLGVLGGGAAAAAIYAGTRPKPEPVGTLLVIIP